MAIASIVVTAIALVAIPADYFLGPDAPDWTRHRHPLLRWGFRFVRNIVGWLLVLFGICAVVARRARPRTSDHSLGPDAGRIPR